MSKGKTLENGMALLSIGNLQNEFLDGYDQHFWPVDLFQYVKVRIIGDNKFCIGSYRTIYELVIVDILFNESEVDIYFLINSCMQASNGLHYIMGNFLCRFFS